MKYVLTIAGSDSCGGAGIQADIKTITGLGAHALTVITAVTSQNSLGISDVHELPAEFIAMQIKTVVEDIPPNSIKIGMLSSAMVIETVTKMIKKFRLSNIILDPIIKSSTGHELIDASAIALLKDTLLPLVDVITPNLHEAGVLSGEKVSTPVEMESAARELKKLGPDVIITGGHLEGECLDLLYDGKESYHFRDNRIQTANTHGTGCVFSSSLASFLAMDKDLIEAARLAHEFTRQAIEKGYPCGRGAGCVSPCS